MHNQDKVDNSFTIYYLSEQAITIEFGHEINEDLLLQINRFDDLIKQKPFPGFRTTVPAYTTLSIFFDPLLVIKSLNLPGRDCFEKVSGYIRRLEYLPDTEVITPANTIITIPVCYGGSFGPDLVEVAMFHNLIAHEVITLHSSAIYMVYMIGFVPGFAYLGGMPDTLATPRKPVPRKAVPAGSIGIAGQQTGIYPMETPGGWQIIGRTPLTLFNVERPQPALLKSGDHIVFKSIDHDEF